MKHWKYLKYITRHRWYVFWECVKLGIPLLGLAHDFSKFLPSEWWGYANSFYGGWAYSERPPEVVAAYELAWLLHQHRNKHHWQWYLLQFYKGENKALNMPIRYRKEMLADWIGAGKAQASSGVHAWYMMNRAKMTLHPEVRTWIEMRLFGGREPDEA